MSNTPIITMRLNPDLAAWVLKHAKEEGVDRTWIVSRLLQALQDRRLVILDEPVPYSLNQGTDPERPVLVFLAPKTETK